MTICEPKCLGGIKVEHSDGDGALRSSKIQVRCELDTSKIEVR